MALHSMYVVAWADDIWKAGISSSMPKRMAQFRNDAVLVDRFDFLARDDAFWMEKATLHAFGRLGEAAFTGAYDSLDHLAGGVGWSECYRLPVELGSDLDRSKFYPRRAAHSRTWAEVLAIHPARVEGMPSYIPHFPALLSRYDRATPLSHVVADDEVA